MHGHAPGGRGLSERLVSAMRRAAEADVSQRGMAGGVRHRSPSDRAKALQWAHATFFHSVASSDFAGWPQAQLVDRIEAALVHFRRLGQSGSYAYDLPTHEALLKIYRAELARMGRNQ